MDESTILGLLVDAFGPAGGILVGVLLVACVALARRNAKLENKCDSLNSKLIERADMYAERAEKMGERVTDALQIIDRFRSQ